MACKITGGAGKLADGKHGLKRHFFYHPVRVNKELLDEELPSPDTVRKAKELFEEMLLFRSMKNGDRSTSIISINDTCKGLDKKFLQFESSYNNNMHGGVGGGLRKWDSASLSSGVSSGDLSSPCDCNDNDDTKIISNGDELCESYYVSQVSRTETFARKEQRKQGTRRHAFSPVPPTGRRYEAATAQGRRPGQTRCDILSIGMLCSQFAFVSISPTITVSQFVFFCRSGWASIALGRWIPFSVGLNESAHLASHTHLILFLFSHPLSIHSQDILEKIRECGSSVTYYGGRVLNNHSNGVSPISKAIMREIHSEDNICGVCQPHNCPHGSKLFTSFCNADNSSHLGKKPHAKHSQ